MGSRRAFASATEAGGGWPVAGEGLTSLCVAPPFLRLWAFPPSPVRVLPSALVLLIGQRPQAKGGVPCSRGWRFGLSLCCLPVPETFGYAFCPALRFVFSGRMSPLEPSLPQAIEMLGQFYRLLLLVLFLILIFNFVTYLFLVLLYSSVTCSFCCLSHRVTFLPVYLVMF